jgi:iron(III) transport system ATP-binding protein
MTPRPPAILCQELRRNFGEISAVRGVSLAVEEGRLLALLGPSGCGKTTMLRLIAGFETPDQGRIEIGGQTVADGRLSVPPEARRVGMVFQDYALFPHLTVEANVAFGLDRSPLREPRLREVLALVGLEAVRGRLPHELSGGQQQRVALARALAPSPRVILLDEPFSNLDAALRDRVRREVRHILRQAGVTAVFVTHDQEEALSLADEVAVMMEGRLLQVDRPERLYRRPNSHVVAGFLGDANFLPADARGEAADSALGPLHLMEAACGPVEVMVRPEDTLVEADPAGPGVILEREFFGHDQRLLVGLDSGLRVKARTVGCCRGLHQGVRVRVRVDLPVMAYPSAFGCPLEPAVPGAATARLTR